MGGLSGPEQQYALRWNDYHTSILSSFRHLRDEEDFVDVTLACDGRSFTAHKVVLSACSPYFRTLLKANPCQHPIVILRDVREQDMKALLKFMYNGEVHIGEEQLPDFLKTAQTLQVRGLADVPPKEHHKFNSTGPNPVPWSVPSVESRLGGDEGLTPPPVKRSRSSDHLTSPSPSSTPINISTLNNNNNNNNNESNQNNRDTLLSQALENPSQLLNNSSTTIKVTSESSSHAHSTGEDSNSSDTELSERGHSMTGDGVKSEPNSDFNDHGGHLLDHSRAPPNFPAALLNLQGLPGIPGLLPGPSGMHGNNQDSNFVSRRSGLDMLRVRATDPRPCPKCHKIYRSAHTLRTHLEDKHTKCPGYRCVLCGTVAKSRNSLHSHMSRQHRGISTKDLPVLPMPSPFDPELASRLLAKAGIKISPAELRARASPTGQTTPGLPRLDLKSRENSNCGSEDPEDLTVHSSINHSGRFGSVELRAISPPPNYQAVISKFAGANLSLTPSSDREVPGPSGPTGNPLLDTYLQMIAENSYQLSAEQAAKMAAKISSEQRLALENNHMMDDAEYSSGAEDEFSEEEPEPIKAE